MLKFALRYNIALTYQYPTYPLPSLVVVSCLLAPLVQTDAQNIFPSIGVLCFCITLKPERATGRLEGQVLCPYLECTRGFRNPKQNDKGYVHGDIANHKHGFQMCMGGYPYPGYQARILLSRNRRELPAIR
jgi:hypothetical protein